MKSHSATKKRFKKNGNGNIKRAKAFKRHHAWSKNKKQKNRLCGSDYLNNADAKNISKLIPY